MNGERYGKHRNFIITSIVIMLLGGGMVIVLTFYNENPLRELLVSVRGMVKNIPEDMSGYDVIRHALKSMGSRILCWK